MLLLRVSMNKYCIERYNKDVETWQIVQADLSEDEAYRLSAEHQSEHLDKFRVRELDGPAYNTIESMRGS